MTPLNGRAVIATNSATPTPHPPNDRKIFPIVGTKSKDANRPKNTPRGLPYNIRFPLWLAGLLQHPPPLVPGSYNIRFPLAPTTSASPCAWRGSGAGTSPP